MTAYRGGLFDEADSQVVPDEMTVKPNPLAPKVAVPLTPAQRIETASPTQVKREIAARLRAITAADFRGLTPDDIDNAMRQQIAIDTLTEQYADQVNRSGIAISAAQRRTLERAEDKADKRNELIFKSKEGAAKSVAESNLTPEEQAKWLERITKTERFEDALALAIEASSLPKRQTSGVDRDAVASELYNGRNFSQLKPDEQAKVNSELYNRDRFVVVNGQGIWSVDKRTGRGKLITRDPTSAVPKSMEGRTFNEPNTQSGEARSDVTTRPSAPSNVPAAEPSSDILVDGLKRMGPAKARAWYERALTDKDSSAARKEEFYNAIIQAHPDLANQLRKPSAPVGPGRQSNLETDVLQFVGGPAEPTTFTVGAAPTSRLASPFAERVINGLRGLGVEKALKLTDEILDSDATYNEKELYREALMVAYPELETIPTPPRENVESSPRERSSFGPREATAQQPLEGRTPSQSSQRPTEAQSKAFEYGKGAFAAQSILRNLEDLGTTQDAPLPAMFQTLADLTKAERAAIGGTAGGLTGELAKYVTGKGFRVLQAVQRGRAAVPLTVGTPATILGRAAIGLARPTAIGTGVGIVGALLAQPIANALRTTEEQQYFQAKSDFITNVLRKQSGAAVTDTEYTREERRFFPSRNDDPATIKQKSRARDLFIQTQRVTAGKDLWPDR